MKKSGDCARYVSALDCGEKKEIELSISCSYRTGDRSEKKNNKEDELFDRDEEKQIEEEEEEERDRLKTLTWPYNRLPNT